MWGDGGHFCTISLPQILMRNPSYLHPGKCRKWRVKLMIPHESNTLPGKMEKEGRFPLEPSYFLNDGYSSAPKEATELQLL